VGRAKLLLALAAAALLVVNLLETPDGTFPALSVNGTLTEAELHDLVDSLVPVGPK
jgi:hypothetical protein